MVNVRPLDLSKPHPTRRSAKEIYRPEQLQSSAEPFFKGVAFSLYGKRAGKSFEFACVLLHACLVLVLSEIYLRSRGGHTEEPVLMLHVYWSRTPIRR